MSFSEYSSLQQAIKGFHLIWSAEEFVRPDAVEVSVYLREEIDFMQKFVGLPRTESARRQTLIFPLLRETWKHFPQMQLWIDEPLQYDASLTGTPDYFLSRRSEQGIISVEPPYLLVMETKKDDFDWGWGQCAAGMVAARKLNNWPDQVVYGIVTNGRNWEFGKLTGDHFIQDPNSMNWLPLENVCGDLHFMFEQCRLQLAAYAGAA